MVTAVIAVIFRARRKYKIAIITPARAMIGSRDTTHFLHDSFGNDAGKQG